MATLTLTLTDAQLARVRAAAANAGFTANDAGIQQWIALWMRDSVRTIERRKAEEQVAPPADF